MQFVRRFWALMLVFTLGLAVAARAADEEVYSDTSVNTDTSETTVRRPAPDLHAGLDLQYSRTAFPHYQMSPRAVGTQLGHFAQLGLEWLPFGDAIGKLGVGGGIGYFFLNNTDIGGGQRQTISAYPLRGYLSYRADYMRHQILVPFAKVGVSATWINQTGTPGTRRFDGLDYGGGVELCLNLIDPGSSRSLDQSTGIHNTYLVAEYTKTDYLRVENRTPDLRHDELRFGLRFEM